MAGVSARSVKKREEEIEQKLLITRAELSRLMHISPQSISKAIKFKRMFDLEAPNGRKVVPAFYADARYDLKGLYSVSQALGELPGALKWIFFTRQRPSLAGKSPLEALAEGRLEKVMLLASAYAEA